LFAAVSGDNNALHINQEFAQNLRFMAPVRAGDTVHATVTVKELIPEKCRARLTTVCTVDGEIVIDGDALVMTRSREARKT
jgi:3-hydroxybutyryl-CoA dehydratase